MEGNIIRSCMLIQRVMSEGRSAPEPFGTSPSFPTLGADTVLQWHLKPCAANLVTHKRYGDRDHRWSRLKTAVTGGSSRGARSWENSKGKRGESADSRRLIPCPQSQAQLSPATTATEPADLELACTATAGAVTQPLTKPWRRFHCLRRQTDGRQQPWNIQLVTCIFSVCTRGFTRVCIPRKYKWQLGYSMVYHESVLHNYFKPCHKKKQFHNQCDICPALDGKVGCNTVEYTTAFVYSDWLYFLWHDIKRDTTCNRITVRIISPEIVSETSKFASLHLRVMQKTIFFNNQVMWFSHLIVIKIRVFFSANSPISVY